MQTKAQSEEIIKARVEAILAGHTNWPAMLAPNSQVEQKALVSGHHLPRDIDSLTPVTWEELCARWNMKVLGSVKANFFAVQMPAGWHLQVLGEESLWSSLLDEQGRERATIYYQPSFTDRTATMYLSKRYNVFTHYLDPTDRTVRIISARDQKRIFHEFGRVFPNTATYFRDVERIEEVGRLWFDEHFPNWQDPFAYWDEQP